MGIIPNTTPKEFETTMGYIGKKARENAKTISAMHRGDYAAAYSITRPGYPRQVAWVGEEARAEIRRAAQMRGWQTLSFNEKARICERVVRMLLDNDRQKRLAVFCRG